eukprot:CAMPEP_0170479824 /NCGR_PEP_ID=MMETSP0208-20121228/905_1 /TAXON_ID=197538 /ORGANISM="Strombidium inclinatum, Strain S3" /LENGTH=35 /DNA_ID= /DNA_START= /DNA_END= /DNA_ORIENTATION=
MSLAGSTAALDAGLFVGGDPPKDVEVEDSDPFVSV